MCVLAAHSSGAGGICDDLGYSDVGFNGAEDIATPNLDRLARGGTVFTSAYVAHPFCGPSRMGLMTGRYPHEFGAPFNLPNSGRGIEQYNEKGGDQDETLISTMLQRSGYYTGAVGKWHMGIAPPFHPNARGFDEFYGFLGGGHKYFPAEYQPTYDRQRRAGSRPWQLFRIIEDIGESHDVSNQHPQRLKRMVAEVEKWSRTRTEPRWFHTRAAAKTWQDTDISNSNTTFPFDQAPFEN